MMVRLLFMDCITPLQRFKNMSSIKDKGTKVEVCLAKALLHLGYRYRKNNQTDFAKTESYFLKT
jgi:DNA mismatch endonuclease (patch repair protein)